MRRKAARICALACLALLASGLWLFWATRPLTDIADRPLAPLPQGPLAITLLGSSLTTRNDWPEALQEALEICTDQPVAVNRVAQAGAGSAWGLQAVEEVIAQSPDLVVMEFAINDADIRDGVSLKTARAQHEAILARLTDALPQAQILLMTMSPAHGPRGWTRPFLARHYAQYRKLAEAHGAGLLDLYPRWLATKPETRHFPDGLHPGNSAVRAVLLEPLTAMFCKGV